MATLKEILKELGQLYEQQKRFVTPAPADEPIITTLDDLTEYFKRSERIHELNRELPKAVEEESETKYKKTAFA